MVEAFLALTSIARVLFLQLRSVRWILFFLLFPLIIAPLLYFFPESIDYRISWLVYQAFWWVCLVGLIFALLTAIFAGVPDVPGLLKFSRICWTATLAACVVTAMSQTEFPWPPVLNSAITEAFVFGTAVQTVVAFVALLLLGCLFWYGIKIPANVRVVSIGVGIILVAEIAAVIDRRALHDVIWKWVNASRYMAWIVCLVYWNLYLSSSGETVAR